MQAAVVILSYCAAWFADCDESDDDCNFDYVKFNFWNSITGSLRGLLGFLFSAFIESLTDSNCRKPFLLMPIVISSINYTTLSISGNLVIYFVLVGIKGLFTSSGALNSIMTAHVSDTISNQDLKTIGFSIALAMLALNVLIGVGLGTVISITWNTDYVFIVMSIGYGICGLSCLLVMAETVSNSNGNKR